MTKARDLANGGFGLVLVKPSSVVGGTDNGKGTISYSGATSVSLNGVFNSTYKNYRLIINQSSASSTVSMRCRMRTNSSDDSGGNYALAGLYTRSDSATIASWRDAIGLTSWYIGDFNSSRPTVFTVEVYNPFIATQTTLNVACSNPDTSNTIFAFQHQGYNSQATAQDGFTIFPASGNITGTISVYGYNN